jgi:parallel beta-helix repeat protein
MVEKIFIDDYLAPDPRLEPPDRFSGRGIVVRNAKNVTIRNAKIRGFRIAIYAENCANLTIENCDVSNNYRQRLRSTPQREHLDDWLYGHDNDIDEWLRYGAGIYLKNCEGATIKNCRARNGQNGICLVRCDKATVVGCDMSFMSGWGLAMWRSNFCKIIGNRFDYCVRGYSHGVYARGQDSAGILVYEQCSDNVFAYNHATHGGDGFFLYAGNETVKKTGEGGCNRNLIYDNDFSYAVANGIEATFSDQNVFVGNKLNHCEHGVWAGYSTRSLIAGNTFNACKNGVSIEHGRHNRIYRNQFLACERGVRLWWDDNRELLSLPYAKLQGALCESESIRENLFADCKTAILASNAKGLGIETNDMVSCETVLLARGGKESFDKVSGNECKGGRVSNESAAYLTQFAFSGLDEAPCNLVVGQFDKVPEGILARKSEHKPGQFDDRLLWNAVSDSNIDRFPTSAPDRVGSKTVGPLPGIPEGKEFILVNEWGPYDFTEPKVSPENTTAWAFTAVQVLGKPDEAFKVTSVSPGVTVSPMTGKTPATVTISLGEGNKGAYVAFDVKFQVGKTPLAARGALLNATWSISYYQWKPFNDPRADDMTWQSLRRGEPFLRQQTHSIDFRWRADGPTPDVKDRFALVATSELALPAGRWRLRTISDDGVRVFVDGRKAIDNWTWHVPTEDTTEMTLPAGSHEFRIEYFEIDGHAQLQFFIEPAGRSDPRP